MAVAIPAIAMGIGALGSWLSHRSQAKQAENQSNLYNDWLKNYQNTGQNLFGQAQANGWNPYGPQTSTHQSSGVSSSNGSSSYSNRPVITGEYQGIDNLMRGIMTGRLSGGSSLPAGYAENAIRGINQSFEGADQAARNMAARRGLSGEQTYAIASPANRARAGKIADLRGSLPLLEREMQNQDIGIASGLQSAFGRGEQGQSRTSQSGTTSSSGSQTNPFSAGDLSALMGVLAPPNPQQTTQTGLSPLGSGLSSLGGLMGFLAANKGQGQQQIPWQSVSSYGPAGVAPSPYGYG